MEQHFAQIRKSAKIETNSKGAVSGVVLANGEQIAADAVIMNGDSATLDTLLGRKPKRQPTRSMSGFVMLQGIRRTMPKLEQHTIAFSADYQREFSQIFEEHRFPDDPTVYVNAPSRGDRSLTPGEGETLFIMANAPGTDSAMWGEQEIATARERVFRRLRKAGFPDLSGDIVTEDTWTPQRIADRYHMPGGAIYGSDSHGWRNAFFRPPNQDRHVRGLYRVGGSTHPGGGTPTVLISAEITSRLVEARFR